VCFKKERRWGRGEGGPMMYTDVNKCKNDKIFLKGEEILHALS
jgi:hypothetical protein